MMAEREAGSTGEREIYLSLCMIVGDEGVKTLARCLKSALDRDGVGPIVDEIVIGWNGSNDAGLRDALNEAMGLSPTLDPDDAEIVLRMGGPCPIRIIRQKWKNDFAIARNEVHGWANGVWHLWLDSDDILPHSDADIVGKKLREAGMSEADVQSAFAVPAKPQALHRYLRSLHPSINVIVAPYLYVIVNNEVLQEHPKRRIIRWSDGWMWKSEDGTHEDPIPTYGNREQPLINFGFPICHYPETEALQRLARNASIRKKRLEEMTAAGASVGYRTWSNLAAQYFDEGELQKAYDLYSRAAVLADEHGQDLDSCFNYYQSGRICLRTGNVSLAASAGHQILSIDPSNRYGYLLLMQASMMSAKWSKCLVWFEALKALPKSVIGIQKNNLEEEAWPIAWAAESKASLGQYKDAVLLAKEALNRAPNDEYCKRVLEGCSKAAEKGEAVAAVRTLVGFHLRNGDLLRARQALYAAPTWEETAFFRDLESEIEAATLLPVAIPDPISPEIEEFIRKNGFDDSVVEVDVHTTGNMRMLVPSGSDAPKRVIVETLGPRPIYGRHSSVNSEDVLSDGWVYGDVEQMTEIGGRAVSLITSPGRPFTSRSKTNGGAITIFAPAFNERWQPEWARGQGIGGSEEAIVYLSEALVRMGWSVEVFHPGEQSMRVRVFNGVEYRRLEDFRASDPRDILIAHRAPWIMQHRPGADQVFVWHHDHSYPTGGWTKQRAQAAPNLLVSAWQGAVLASQIEGSEFEAAVIGNGVPSEQCLELTDDVEAERNPYKAVYASQPVRGLSKLLEVWPEILATVPEAELHVYYGFQTNESAAKADPQVAAELEKVKKLIGESRQVAIHPRIGQEKLMDVFRSSGVMLYPATYPEVSCISALRAAAAGCFPVFNTAGNALGETQPRQAFASDKKWDEGGREDFVRHAIQAFKDGADVRARRDLRDMVLMEHTWGRVAQRLVEVINTVVEKQRAVS